MYKSRVITLRPQCLVKQNDAHCRQNESLHHCKEVDSGKTGLGLCHHINGPVSLGAAIPEFEDFLTRLFCAQVFSTSA